MLGSGIMTLSVDACDLSDKLKLKPGILEALMIPGLDRAGLLARFQPESEPSDLDWADIDHLQAPAGLARDILAAALRERRPGVNVLLYGETGTGKTQLARLLARDVSAKFFVAGHSDDDGESPSARERLSSLVLGHRLLSEVPALLLFDELEDLFELHWQRVTQPSSSAAPTMSKQWFNHLLETNALPTIWITNDATSADRAFLRRFGYVMEFCALGPRQRARVLRRQLGAADGLSATEVDSIAQRFAASLLSS